MNDGERFHGESDDIVGGQVRDSIRRHGILRPRLTEEKYQELARAVDEETTFSAGGFETTRSYSALLTQGPRVVPFLMHDLDGEGGLWRAQMVSFYASEVFGQPIELPGETGDYVDPFIEKVREWWEQTGRPYYESMEPALRATEIPQLP